MTNPFDFFAVDLIIVVLSFDIVFLALSIKMKFVDAHSPMTNPFVFFAVDLILVVLYCLLLLFFVHQ